MPEDAAKRFWDARASEDAFHFVDNRIAYGDTDEERFWQEGERDLDRLLQLLELRVEAEDDVVEIGCGVGRLTRVLATRAAGVRALDVSREMLTLAQRHNPGLENVEWIEGDGVSLAGIADASADACVSHVVFQHIPDPAITLGYVREIGRVLRPGGWAGFQISNDASVHSRSPGLRERLAAALGRSPRGMAHPNWRGSHVDLDDLRGVAAESGTVVERVVGEGEQFCLVRLRRA